MKPKLLAIAIALFLTGRANACDYSLRDAAFADVWPNEDVSALHPSTEEAYWTSPLREQLLDLTLEHLCVILVSTGDASTREAALAAARQVEDQLTLLDKPIAKGPVVINLTPEQAAMDPVLGTTLGLPNSQPSVTILFGRGRRLGPVLTGADISKERISVQAALAGRDCECQLDRKWLYGPAFPHRWDAARQKVAATVLGFDPGAANIRNEIARILQNGPNTGAAPDFNSLKLGYHEMSLDDPPAIPAAASTPAASPPNPPPPTALNQHAYPPGVEKDWGPTVITVVGAMLGLILLGLCIILMRKRND